MARERGCRQKMRVCPEACSLFLSLACFWYSRWRLEQVWHRVSSRMGGAPHSTQMPRSLALSLLSWVLRRINSLPLWSLGPLAFVLAAFLLPGFQLCWCRLYSWFRLSGLWRGLP